MNTKKVKNIKKPKRDTKRQAAADAMRAWLEIELGDDAIYRVDLDRIKCSPGGSSGNEDGYLVPVIIWISQGDVDANERKMAFADDRDLSAEELDDKYNPNGDGEHPLLTRKEWRAVVGDGGTSLGYWQWLRDKMNEVED